MAGSSDDNTFSVCENTILKLAESMSQQVAANITSMNIPEFGGNLNEDVGTFLRRFKLATFTLTPEMKCLALRKALTGPAYIWYRNNIRDKVAKGDWKAVKTELRERFQGPNNELKYHEKLSRMKFDSKEGSLLSYIEGFSDCYRSAYPDCEDSAVIKALKINLPNNVVKALNITNDNWTFLDSVKSFLGVAKRAEENLLTLENNSLDDDKLSAPMLAKVLAEFRDSIKELRAERKEDEKIEPNAAVAAIKGAASKDNQTSGRNYDGPRDSGRNRNKYQKRYRQDPYPNKERQSGYKDKPEQSFEELKNSYYERFGKPPGPCWYCKGDHLNAHCPLVNTENLK